MCIEIIYINNHLWVFCVLFICDCHASGKSLRSYFEISVAANQIDSAESLFGSSEDPLLRWRITLTRNLIRWTTGLCTGTPNSPRLQRRWGSLSLFTGWGTHYRANVLLLCYLLPEYAVRYSFASDTEKKKCVNYILIQILLIEYS